MDGLVDGLERFQEVGAGTAEGHPDGPVAVLVDARVVGAQLEVGRGGQPERELSRVPAEADLVEAAPEIRGAERRTRGRQREDAARGLRLEHARGGGEQVRGLVPGESQVPEAEPANCDAEPLVLLPPLRARGFERVLLVRREDPHAQVAEKGPFGEVAVLLEFLAAGLGRCRRKQTHSPFDLAFQVDGAERDLSGGRPDRGRDRERDHHRHPGPCPRAHAHASARRSGPPGDSSREWSHGSSRIAAPP